MARAVLQHAGQRWMLRSGMTQSLRQSSFARAINACGIERLCACTTHSSETAFRCVSLFSMRACDATNVVIPVAAAGAAAW